MIELVLALGGAMVVGNVIAIVRRNKDRTTAREALQTSSRPSRHVTKALAKEQVKQGTATLAVAPLRRSLFYISIGAFAFVWAAATLLR